MIRWIIFLLTVSSTAFCQQIIHGSVIDKETGNPVPFASVGIVGTSQGTSTNLDGKFSLAISGTASIKITCIGYESLTLNSPHTNQQIQLVPASTQLNEVIVTSKPVNARTIVRRAFAHVSKNYSKEDFLQQFFYRHYCKDDSIYGRLIEASVDVYKHHGYRTIRRSAGDKQEIRITQLRRSLDNTIMSQGHEPISVGNMLMADMAGFQTADRSSHILFYEEASNLKTDFENYSYSFDGFTTYDHQQVYKINYAYKEDSILTTSGYIPAPKAKGSLYITTDGYAFVKTEDIKSDGPNILMTSVFYRKHDGNYYPYHIIREGENKYPHHQNHSFHIEMMSVAIQHPPKEFFTSHEPGKEELLKIPYDSVFWNTQTILKTTPLEDEIIYDLGGGTSLNQQFYRYQKFEWSTSHGEKNATEKFNWFKDDSKDRRILYLCFWSGDLKSYLNELEQIKQLNMMYRNKITFVLLSLENDEIRWKQILDKYNLFADGILNYRIGENSEISNLYKIKETPVFILLTRDGQPFNSEAKRASDPSLQQDFKLLLKQGSSH